MIAAQPVDELREARRRLAEEQRRDPEGYAAMLAEVGQALPGAYVDKPLVPQAAPPSSAAKAS